MVVKDIVDLVASKSSLVIGKDLFLGAVPENLIGISFMEVPGTENDAGMLSQGVRIMSFYHDYLTAQEKCKAVYDILAYNNGFKINNVRYFNCVPLATPNFFGQDLQGKFIFSTTLVVFRER